MRFLLHIYMCMLKVANSRDNNKRNYHNNDNVNHENDNYDWLINGEEGEASMAGFGYVGLREREMSAMVSALTRVVSGDFPSHHQHQHQHQLQVQLSDSDFGSVSGSESGSLGNKRGRGEEQDHDQYFSQQQASFGMTGKYLKSPITDIFFLI